MGGSATFSKMRSMIVFTSRPNMAKKSEASESARRKVESGLSTLFGDYCIGVKFSRDLYSYRSSFWVTVIGQLAYKRT